MRMLQTALLLLATMPLIAVQANQSDFARGRVLDTSDGSVVQRLTVPDDVYEWLTRRDLGDLRVFNRDQEEVPYNVRRPAGLDEYAAWQSLPLFVLPHAESEEGGGLDLKVEVNESGAIVSYQGGTVGPAGARAFLLDASALKQTPTEMKLSWHDGDGGESISRIRLESSDDLNDWQLLIADTTIARLSNAGNEVRLDQFHLPPRKARYLRITQIEGRSPLSITGVDVRYRRSELPERRWRTLAGHPVDDGWEFQSGGWFPVDRLQLTSDENFLVSARLYSREREENDWRDRGERTFYRSMIAGTVAESEPVYIDEGDRFWRIEFDGPALDSPALRISWLPDEVVFLRQGPGPYVLAYGQAGVESRQWPLTELLRKLNGGPPVDLANVPFARLMDAQMLGGPDRLVTEPEPIDWRTIVLWMVLVLGVLAVGAMAYRLLRN